MDCLKQIIVVVDDSTDDQAFTDLETKLATLSDRWSSVCKFVGTRWFTVQDLLIKLQGVEADYAELSAWISRKSGHLDALVERTGPLVLKHELSGLPKAPPPPLAHSVDDSAAAVAVVEDEFASSAQLIRALKLVELEMQAMHSKLNDMNELGEQIGTQLNNSPQLSAAINAKVSRQEVF